VIPEVVNQICFQVIGNDVTVTMAAEGGQLELNAFEPIILFNLQRSIDLLARGCRTLTRRCVQGITANRDVCRVYVERSIGLATALNPLIGYEKAAEVAKEALRTGRTVGEVALAKGYLTREQLDEILRPEAMLAPLRPRRGT
jgi:aspartate ammonia-lyase